MLHLLLFAAAPVLLFSARDTCLRLLALDEAFAGVDDKTAGANCSAWPP